MNCQAGLKSSVLSYPSRACSCSGSCKRWRTANAHWPVLKSSPGTCLGIARPNLAFSHSSLMF